MKYFLCLCISVLPFFTEQQLVVLKPSNTNAQKSHEASQLAGEEDKNEEYQEYQESSQLQLDDQFGPENVLAGNVPSSDTTDEEVKGSNDKEQTDTESKATPDNDGMIFILQIPSNFQDKKPVSFDSDKKMQHWNRWVSEIAAGNKADISGTNPRIYQPNKYRDFGRRFVPQYQYTEKTENVVVAPDNKEIIPKQAPLDVVKRVAKQSILEEEAKPQDITVNTKALRTGDYWNAVWVEEGNPKTSPLRMSKQHVLGTIKAKIKPGTEFYDLVSNMTKISPRLLYIINTE